MFWQDINALNKLAVDTNMSSSALAMHGLDMSDVGEAISEGYLKLLTDREAVVAGIADPDLFRGCSPEATFYLVLKVPEAVEDPAVVAYREEMRIESERQAAEQAKENERLIAEQEKLQKLAVEEATAARKKEIDDAVAAALAARDGQ